MIRIIWNSKKKMVDNERKFNSKRMNELHNINQ